ncbi:MAG: GDSL-type esterase/lipase family protein [Xenococcaceae cyanobacterium MO_188.B32]|nr:GDSL-type esterase/lipase family protein [Xenococcaceae cyanobacterium MO_188.B32]
MSNIRIEAEQMVLDGYRIKRNRFASGGKLIGLSGREAKETGTASFKFAGPKGYYQVVLGCFDENDGVSTLTIKSPSVNTSLKLDRKLSGNIASEQTKVRKTIATKLWVKSGDTFTITGIENRGEPARVDYIDFIPMNNSNPVNSSDTADYGQAANGIIANLTENKVLKPIFGTTKQPKILAIGDSITDGTHRVDPTPGAYRTKLWNNLVDNGFNVDFVGSRRSGPSNLGDIDHEGHPGWTINQITTLVDNGQLPYSDVNLLMIGTNDVLRGDRTSTLKSELSQLIDKITEDRPDAHLVVSSIAPLYPSRRRKSRADIVKAYNEVIPELVEEKAAQGQKITYVNGGGSLSLDDLVLDGIHPTAEGYDKLGKAWYDALVDRDSLSGVANIIGTAFNDRLTGDTNDNEIKGGGGSDTLTGAGGKDSFIYENPAQGSDVITDFRWGDRFIISASGFGGGLVEGVGLSRDESSSTGIFVSSDTPISLGSSANFLYETDTGILSFDRDGSGSMEPWKIATLSNTPTLRPQQFTIVA